MPQYQGQHIGVGHLLPDTDDSKQAFRAAHFSLCSMDPVWRLYLNIFRMQINLIPLVAVMNDGSKFPTAWAHKLW